MKNIKHFVIILISLSLLNSCKEDTDTQPCPQNETISMKINGVERQFEVIGRGIDFNNVGSGHTLHLNVFTGVFSPQQDSYSITLKLPYKGTGSNIIKEIRYFRVQDATSIEGGFVQGQLQSKVKVNTNTCISATFSGSAIINGNEIIISEGIINHIYDDPFQSINVTTMMDEFPEDWVKSSDLDSLMTLIGSTTKCNCFKNPLSSHIPVNQNADVGGYAIIFINSFRQKKRISLGLYNCPKTNKESVDEIIKWWTDLKK